MEFDFLPKLPNSNLDDRAYKDLVQECLLRIPRYCPEWTNYNPSDPGITLIELFAWLTDQMQLRFNQVPRRNYVAFLELLGIRLAPPTPAHTDLTFYLSSAQPFPIAIPRDTEVATERTATEEAVVFSTDRELIIGTPQIKHFLTADTPAHQPTVLQNRFSNSRYERNRNWEDIDNTSLFTNFEIGNCFYLVLATPSSEEGQSIQGNVLELLLRGEPATGTGINPEEPPRVWQAWDGKAWQPILRQELDDKTKGFNFDSTQAQEPTRLQQATILLHLPQDFPEEDFGTDYRGHWIRCVYQLTRRHRPEFQQRYSTSPRIVGLAIQAIGGTVSASQCIRVHEELLGVSTGKPGQTFQLQMQPVIDRHPEEEYIEVRPPDSPPEPWDEVQDFSQSTAESPHYTIDARTGTVQFGPVIRGPMRLKQQTDDRLQTQAPTRLGAGPLLAENGRTRRSSLFPLPDPNGQDISRLERQYGRIPPPGSEIYMMSYRFGGGRRGNVQPEKLIVLKSALPYISQVTNYQTAKGGDDAESLEEAVMRVPQLLRTRECAVTPEDFEAVVKKFPRVARAHCLTEPEYTTPGIVRLLVVPQVDPAQIDWTQGMNPDQVFQLDNELRQDLENYLRNRRPLGIYVKLQEPDYVGVSVKLNVLLEPRSNPAEIRTQLQIALYQFLNPLTGGIDGAGWSLGRPIYISDIVSLCQKIPGVRHLGSVRLFEVRKYEDGWTLFEAIDSAIEPGPLGLVCSWAGEVDHFDPGHEIHFIE